MSSPLEVSDNTAPAAAPEQSALQASTYFQGGNQDYFSAVEAAESSTTSSSADSMLNGFELDFGAAEGSNHSDNPASNSGNDSSSNDNDNALSASQSQPEGVSPGEANPTNNSEASPPDSEAHSRDSRNSNSDDEKPSPEREQQSRREATPQEQPNEDKQESETCSVSRSARGERGGLAGIFSALIELQQQEACNQEIAEIRARNERRRQSLP